MSCTDKLAVSIKSSVTDKFGGTIKLISIAENFDSVFVYVTTPWNITESVKIFKGSSKWFAKDNKTYTVNIIEIGYFTELGCTYTACYTNQDG